MSDGIFEIDGASKGYFHDKNGNISEYVNFIYRSDSQFEVAQKLASYIQSIRNLLNESNVEDGENRIIYWRKKPSIWFEPHTAGEATTYTGSFRLATYPMINLRGLIP